MRSQSVQRFRKKHDLNSIFNNLSNQIHQVEPPKPLQVNTQMKEEESPGLKVPKSATNFNMMNKGLYKLENSPSRTDQQEISRLISS